MDSSISSRTILTGFNLRVGLRRREKIDFFCKLAATEDLYKWDDTWVNVGRFLLMDTWAGQAANWTWNNGQDVARIGFGTFDLVLGAGMVWTGAGTLPGIGLIAIGFIRICRAVRAGINWLWWNCRGITGRRRGSVCASCGSRAAIRACGSKLCARPNPSAATRSGNRRCRYRRSPTTPKR